MPEALMVSSVRNPQVARLRPRGVLSAVLSGAVVFLSCLSCLKPIDTPSLSSLVANQVTTPSACNPCMIFVTSTTASAAIGVSGMDAICSTQRPVDAPTAPAGTYLALVMAENGSRSLTSSWALHPSTSYTSYANGPIGTTDTMARMPASLTTHIGIISTYAWTGIDTATWSPYPSSTCNSWGPSGVNGRFGDAGATDSTAFSSNNAGCGSPVYHLYCVQQ